MKLIVYSVYDSKAEAYLQPFFMQSKGQALRAFDDMANDPKHQFYRWAEDFVLFELAEYDDQTGQFTQHAAPKSLGVAIEFKKSSSSLNAE